MTRLVPGLPCVGESWDSLKLLLELLLNLGCSRVCLYLDDVHQTHESKNKTRRQHYDQDKQDKARRVHAAVVTTKQLFYCLGNHAKSGKRQVRRSTWNHRQSQKITA